MVKLFVAIEPVILMMYKNVNLGHIQNIYLKRLEVVLNGLKQKTNQVKLYKKKIQI